MSEETEDGKGRTFWIVIEDATAWDTQEQAEHHAKVAWGGGLIYEVVSVRKF